jgi:hypothetical protein
MKFGEVPHLAHAAILQTIRSTGAHTDAAMNPLPSRGLEPSTPVATRSLIGISELDSRLQDQIAEYGRMKRSRSCGISTHQRESVALSPRTR